MAWHWFDWIVIGLYFVVMFFIGMFFAKRTKSTDDYFKAGGRVPALVTAMSIYATALSSISFIAIPASVYNNSWLLGMAPLGIILMVLWAAYTFVPFFRRVNVTTAYDLALIAKAAYANDWVRESMGLAKTSVTLNGKIIYI